MSNTSSVTPKDLVGLSISESIFRNFEDEVILLRMLELLAETDNVFRHISWDEYDAKYHPDDKTKLRSKIRVEVLSYYLTSSELASLVCPTWQKAIEGIQGCESTNQTIGEVILPSDLSKLVCSGSVFNHVEYEQVCQNMMQLLVARGNVFQQLSWEWYKNTYCKQCSESTLAYVKNQFDDIVPYFASMDGLKMVCPSWKKAIDLSRAMLLARDVATKAVIAASLKKIVSDFTERSDALEQIYQREIEKIQKQKYYAKVCGVIITIALVVCWLF